MTASAETLRSLLARVREGTWKPVPGWPYEASDTGLLRNSITLRVLRPNVGKKGRLQCTFQFNKIRRSVRVHRAVAEAWLGPCPIGLEVNHIDGDKLNNAPSNLEYVTGAENHAHATRLRLKAYGLKSGVHTHPERICSGARNPHAKLTLEQAATIRESPRSLKKLAAEYGISTTTVAHIKKGIMWARDLPPLIAQSSPDAGGGA